MSAPETSTTLLRELASDSNHARWTEFVARYRPMMEAFMAARFPGLEADDAISETFAALAQKLSNYSYAPGETGLFRNYLTGILKHKAMRLHRDSARCEKTKEERAKAFCAGGETDGEKELREWKEAVFAIAVKKLLADKSIQERTKQVFVRVALNHESPDSVAESFGIKRNTVDQMKSRMTAKLREIAEELKSVV